MALTKIDDRGLKTPIDLLDNEKIRFGTGNDLQIYHDGTGSYIDNNTGELQISNANSTLFLQPKQGENSLKLIPDGAVELYYDGVKRFETNSAGVKVTGQIEADELYIRDDEKILLGTGSDLQIYHNGTSSFIDNNNGSVYIRNNVDNWNADHIFIEAKSGDSSIKCLGEADVELYYDGSKKLETTSAGIAIDSGGATTTIDIVSDTESSVIFTDHGGSAKQYKIGTNISSNDGQLEFKDLTAGVKRLEITTGGNVRVPDNGKFVAGDGDDLEIYHDPQYGHSWIKESGGGGLSLATNSFELYNSVPNEKMITAYQDGAVELYYDGSKKAETYSAGLKINGSLTVDSNNVLLHDNGKIKLGDSEDLEIFHDGSNSYIQEDGGAGQLILRAWSPEIQVGFDTGSGRSTGEKAFKAYTDAQVELYYDGVKKVETTSYGKKVTGYQTQTALPIASLSHSNAVDISDDVLDSGNFYSDERVNQGSHFNDSNGRFTCPVAGVYRIYFRASIDSTNSNIRLRKNGSTINEAYDDNHGNTYTTTSQTVVTCSANDYLDVQVNRLKAISGGQHKIITFELIA